MLAIPIISYWLLEKSAGVYLQILDSTSSFHESFLAPNSDSREVICRAQDEDCVLETCYCADTAVADCGATSAAGVTVATYSSCAQQQLIG